MLLGARLIDRHWCPLRHLMHMSLTLPPVEIRTYASNVFKDTRINLYVLNCAKSAFLYCFNQNHIYMLLKAVLSHLSARSKALEIDAKHFLLLRPTIAFLIVEA